MAKTNVWLLFLCVASIQMPAYRLLNNASDENNDAPHNQTLLGRHMSRTGTPHITPVQMPDFQRHSTQDEPMHDQHIAQTTLDPTTTEVMHDPHAYSQQHPTMPTYSHHSSLQVPSSKNANFGDLLSVPTGILQQNSSLTCGCLIGIMILLFIITVLLFFIAIRISNK